MLDDEAVTVKKLYNKFYQQFVKICDLEVTVKALQNDCRALEAEKVDLYEQLNDMHEKTMELTKLSSNKIYFIFRPQSSNHSIMKSNCIVLCKTIL